MGLFGFKKIRSGLKGSSKKSSKKMKAVSHNSVVLENDTVAKDRLDVRPTRSFAGTGPTCIHTDNMTSNDNIQNRSSRPHSAIEEAVPPLVQDLIDASDDVSAERPARALRKLFALSEQPGGSGSKNNSSPNVEQQRVEMVRAEGGRLVPVLLEFLQRCGPGSNEQYLALLVLNNISIPTDNKRIIGLEYGGATIVARLLCDDPSCHLMAIILVNLTFTDEDLRRDLVAVHTNMELIPSLALTLRLATYSTELFESRWRMVLARNTRKIWGREAAKTTNELLALLLGKDQAQDQDPHLWMDGVEFATQITPVAEPIAAENPESYVYPETARWCLCALKNLTRPCQDGGAAVRELINTGIVPLLLRYVTVKLEEQDEDDATRNMRQRQKHRQQKRQLRRQGETNAPDEMKLLNSGNDTSASSGNTPEAVDPPHPFDNSPMAWEGNTVTDAALHVIVNLAAVPVSREYLRDIDAILIVSFITKYAENKLLQKQNEEVSKDGVKTLEFQCLKARMALAYLIGSEGYFGQPPAKMPRDSSSLVSLVEEELENQYPSLLLMMESEVDIFIELVANTLHQRALEGPGGYSAGTLTVKYVFFALRCLLTQAPNQSMFARARHAMRLNVLLLKALTKHAVLKQTNIVDSESAADICFSLYLLSTYGFSNTFLPAIFGDNGYEMRGSITSRVLRAHLRTAGITPAGKHAAEQLLSRLDCLKFEVTTQVLVAKGSKNIAIDLRFDKALMEAVLKVQVGSESYQGVKPLESILDRPVLRSKAMRIDVFQKIPWAEASAVDEFPNALIAAQEYSFGSPRMSTPSNTIDEIMIANNIALSASGDQNVESYDYWWKWQDECKQDNECSAAKLGQDRSANSVLKSGFSPTKEQPVEEGNANDRSLLSIFGCGSLCQVY